MPQPIREENVPNQGVGVDQVNAEGQRSQKADRSPEGSGTEGEAAAQKQKENRGQQYGRGGIAEQNILTDGARP
jgi:hypothetical protein